jgi:dGTPase
MSRSVIEATEQLREFLFDKVYNVQSAQKEARKARRALRSLYRHLCSSSGVIGPPSSAEWGERRVVDYIAGMTDQYALRLARRLARSGKID